ncbi:MAG: prepilin-type N-terminal cleavage/methylation domain-containing protein [Planctomycetota bacterium]
MARSSRNSGFGQGCTLGFTLVELLVVIAIIGGLLGILLPVLPRVRDRARQVACSANLRSIGTAVQVHLSDNKDVFPSARYMPPPFLSGDPDPPLPAVLDHTIDERSAAWQCPGDHMVHTQEYTTEDGEPTTCGSSYSYTVALSGRRLEETGFVRRFGWGPSDVPVATDFDAGTFELQSGDEIVVDFFHNKRSILYADYHVE